MIFRFIQLFIAATLTVGLVLAFLADSTRGMALFQILLALVFVFSLVVWPFVNLQQQEIPEEDFQRDVREGF